MSPFARPHAVIAAICAHAPRAEVVFEIGLEHVPAQVPDQFRVAHREDHLHAPVEIARHEVGAPQVHLLVASAAAPEDPAVLEEASHDARDRDAVGHAGDARPQTADAAHEQVHPHARAGGAHEGQDDLGIDERVHLEDEVAGAPGALVLLFPRDEREQALAKVDGGDEQLAKVALARVPGEVVEEARRVVPDVRVAGEEAEVGVEACRDGVCAERAVPGRTPAASAPGRPARRSTCTHERAVSR